MRAICEACDHPQPLDWKPGDLCIECGQAVRRETRCFWCAKWTPAGKFCRRCVAAVVEDRLYVARSRLEDAVRYRFTVHNMLVQLDPDPVLNVAQIYQRHAGTMGRQVAHLRLLDAFHRQRHWS